MSLDISLRSKEPIEKDCRCDQCGHTHKHDEYEYYFDYNITHNLGKMANEAGVYDALWRPYKLHSDYNKSLEEDYSQEMKFENSVTIYAHQLINVLGSGLTKLKSNAHYFKLFKPSNGWGSYGGLVDCVESYLDACKEHPDSIVITNR
jgi:hypothetical protein